MNLSSSSMRLFLNGFRNTLSTNVAFASLPASSRANAAIGVAQILIVQQGEERDFHLWPCPGDPAPMPGSRDIPWSPTRTPEVTSAGVARYTTISEPPRLT